ncbi:MAG: hypothetical protein HXY38_15060 [Chloroflexi bacterium]|nr:hypothetical protein [Chloroflexota bacterium]
MTPLPRLKPTRHGVLAECAAFYDTRGYPPRIADIGCLSPGRVSDALRELRSLGYVVPQSGFRSTAVTLAGRVYLALADAPLYRDIGQAQHKARQIYPTGIIGVYKAVGQYACSRIWHDGQPISYQALDAWGGALPKGWSLIHWCIKKRWWPYWTPDQRKAKKDAA